MKKLFTIIIVTLVAFTLSACGNSLKSNTIVDADLTDREKAILSTTSNQSFVFDFNIEEKYKKISVWVEKYEFGKLVDEPIGPITTEILNNGSIIFTIIEEDAIETQNLFNIGIISNGTTGKMTTSTIVSTKGTGGRSIVWGKISEEMDITNEQMVLASIGYSWGEGPLVSFSTEFYKDIERRIIELENHEVVYLLRCKFTN